MGVLCMVALNAQPSLSQSKQAKELQEAYLEVSNRPFGETAVPLAKWEDRDTLYYAIVGKSRFFPVKNWQRHAGEVGKLTGLTFVEGDTSRYDLLVYLGPLPDFYAFIGKEPPAVFNPSSPSWTSGNWDTGYRMTKGYLCMNDAAIQDGLYAEFLIRRGLLDLIGLRGKSNDKTSLLNPTYDRDAKNYKLTTLDKRLLVIHYHPAIRAGATVQALRDSLAHWVDLEEIAKRKL